MDSIIADQNSEAVMIEDDEEDAIDLAVDSDPPRKPTRREVAEALDVLHNFAMYTDTETHSKITAGLHSISRLCRGKTEDLVQKSITEYFH